MKILLLISLITCGLSVDGLVQGYKKCLPFFLISLIATIVLIIKLKIFIFGWV